MSSKFIHGCRYDGSNKGHYESYFLRANHPDKPLAFWIRYTIFSPKDKPEEAIGELWAIYFDGENNTNVAVKEEFPLKNCHFSKEKLDVSIGAAQLSHGDLQGGAIKEDNRIEWSLKYESNEAPMLLSEEKLYEGSFPKAKALVSLPKAVFSGELIVNDETVQIDHWVGSENHNWGSKHTDEYAWLQVMGFDNEPDVLLECATARLKYGPFWTPWFTPIVLRLDGQNIVLNSIGQSLRAKGGFKFFEFEFFAKNKNIQIEGQVSAPQESFVGLNYYNPPGGSHTCLNSKLAQCELIVTQNGQPPRQLMTQHRAAFEIITDRIGHNVNIMA